MKLTIVAKHERITDTVKEYAQDKIDRLDHFFDRINSIHVTLDKQGGSNRCEIEIAAARGGHHFVASVTNDDDLRAAIDLCVDKSERQLKKLKEKIRSHKGEKNRKKLGRDVKRRTQIIPKEETYEDVVNE
ncbi:MAG: ribosome-associated translation inhibitor RaiA [Planctomycetes bacterium]|jgi:putative sigma-54 modulation protein|nr:ribosome-associated translation inhibitor RaiA [Planctomycetota bacterium]